MAIAAIPQSFFAQNGNAQIWLTWDLVPGATSYSVQRSTDNVTFSSLSTPAVNSYLDTTGVVGTQYFYKVASVNGSGTSSYTNPKSATPTNTADVTLGQIRLQAQQRADRVNSQFVTMPEWNHYINQSYFELYDLLVNCYEDYFVGTPYQFQTTGLSQYTLPTDFYKLLGVDLGLSSGTQGWVTLRKFDFISRNRYVYPQMGANQYNLFDLKYRLVGNTLMFIPQPTSGQFVRVWYIPKLTQLLKDTDILTGVSGWSEYVITDAAIKALQKEESDVSILAAQKMALIKRIEESAMNRDAGQPDTISDTRSFSNRWGASDEPWAGF